MSRSTESIKRILRLEGRISEESSYWFTPALESKAFHCQTCGKFMFNRQHRIIAMLQAGMDQVLKVPPLTLQCAKCGHVYHIHVI